MKKDNYIPEILDDGNVRVTVMGEKCNCCGKTMIKEAAYRVYPPYYVHDFHAQIKLNDQVVSSSNVKNNKGPVCQECKDKGKVMVTCALCGKKINSSDIERAIGDDADYLCVQCYATAPAKTWDEKVDALEDSHQYDFQ